MLHNRASLVEINSFSIRFPFDSTFNEVNEKVIKIFLIFFLFFQKKNVLF